MFYEVKATSVYSRAHCAVLRTVDPPKAYQPVSSPRATLSPTFFEKLILPTIMAEQCTMKTLPKVGLSITITARLFSA